MKLCNNIEEAQPFLKICLLGNTPSDFTSILSEGDFDKNLICPKCSHIVVLPVECQNCEYIICYKCAQNNQLVCDYDGCGEHFTKTPGKVHKLYREMLNQLEFKCPNQSHGCTKTLKYDQLDNHLQRNCEARLQMCPNKCSRTQKYSQAEL